MSNQSSSPIAAVLGPIRNLQRMLGTLLAPFALLLARIVFGYGLYVGGRAKLDPDRLPQVIQFFDSLGIPEPMVYVTAYSEVILGWMLVVGLATRFASAGVIVVMSVALATAHAGDITGLGAIAGIGPVPFLFAALLIGVFGPGWLSLDHVIDKLLFRDDETK